MFGRKLAQTTRIGAVILAGWAMFSSAAQADIDVPVARIVQVGIDPRFEGPMLQVEDAGANPQWTGSHQYYLSSTLGNAGLATILTAISLGQTVFLRIAGTGAEGSLVTIIFLNAPAS